MEYRRLGSTGTHISAIAFGAGPVPALLTDPDAEDRQRRVIARALAAGINWFDTAPGYGDGRSETALGAALQASGAPKGVRVATKIRFRPDQLDDARTVVEASVRASLERLQVAKLDCLQLHNGITDTRVERTHTVTPDDVLDRIVPAFSAVRSVGLVERIGLTGTGWHDALVRVVRSRRFDTIQVPYHMLDRDYGSVMLAAAEEGMAVFAIRVLAGGALADRPPSAYTLQTPYFPLDLYTSDRARAIERRHRLPPRMTLPEASIRFALSHPAVTAAIVGFSDEDQIDQAVRAAGPLDPALLAALDEWNS